MGRHNKEKKNPLSLYTRVRVESCWGVMLGCTAIMGRQNKEKKTHYLCTRGLGFNDAGDRSSLRFCSVHQPTIELMLTGATLR